MGGTEGLRAQKIAEFQMFAVIKTGGKQYKVAKDDVITVEKLSASAGEKIQFGDVLMVTTSQDGSDAVIGTPFIDGASVSAEVVEQTRGDKIIIFKKRRRQGYRRKKGHQQDLTTIKILDISAKGGKKAAAKAEAPKAKTTETETPAAKTEKKDDAEQTTAQGAKPALLTAPNGEADKLSELTGVGPKIVEKLNKIGIYHFSQIAEWTPAHVTWVDQELDLKGRIERDDWIGQAKKSASE